MLAYETVEEGMTSDTTDIQTDKEVEMTPEEKAKSKYVDNEVEKKRDAVAEGILSSDEDPSSTEQEEEES